ncbi:IS110 family transposase [Dehalobacterium formicoaceticum]|uniref:IS110 family transposase n=2 Tax=Dehalobacterium formicoaceticum TaxID=51515 RepID=A0ABT1XZT0_9FIRM|nr:IS110 family transposase [Dehalobacterium formicoaceticum]MCR6544128.1 IS110 family transposase [Dehalobacterium formicoaceticum]MCR6544542.1 IS110 family transposase [Dehalobacterium formicoaceticum]MCR6545740.1 IS110 family transposase [Dehalobacterium formicoaceticum]MCR6546649.1 IS110 family transposase [Dehalobacterium formicoaceticum]
MANLMVGIDVSLRSHSVQFMNDSGDALASFSIPNDLNGAETLLQRILQSAVKYQTSLVRVGMEATSNLGWHLAHFLNAGLHEVTDFQSQVFVLNARKVARFKKGYDCLPKNDRIDAWVIADQLRFGRLPHELTSCIQYEALQRLTRTRFHLMQSIARDKTYFLNQVFLKFSGLRQDNPFSNMFGATCLAVLQELEPEQIVSMSITELVDFLKEKGKNRFDNPEELALFLQKLARSSYRLDKAMADPVNLSLSVMLTVIQTMEKEVTKIDKEIGKIMKSVPETLSSVKGIGPVFAAGIIAEIGDINRFDNHNALAKYTGLVWSQYQSGEFESDETKRLRTGNKYLRYYLVQAANLVRRYDSDYAAFYAKKYSEALKHQHKRALVLTARKLVRLVFMLLKTNKLYTPPERRD